MFTTILRSLGGTIHLDGTSLPMFLDKLFVSTDYKWLEHDDCACPHGPFVHLGTRTKRKYIRKH